MASLPNNKSDHQLNADYLLQQLGKLAKEKNIKTWCLAYSGGVDSQVLLHLLHLTKLNVSAVYIDHGLQAQSSDWARHCEAQCKNLNIPFQLIKVNAAAAKGESPEAAARTARYAAFKELIQKSDCLLTAQHQDDQSETIFLQLLRGAGAAGLAGMPEIATFSNGWHARPLLDISQNVILDYANQNALSWVEDPSNQQVNYDRNYLRHSVMPQLQQRWPALNKTLSVFSQQQAENAELLEVLAEKDLSSSLLEDTCLDINQLNKIENARLRNVLRFWFKNLQKPIPSRAVLEQIVQQINNTSHDSHVLINWANVEVRRFRDKLFCLKKISHDASQVYNWNVKNELELLTLDKKLKLEKCETSDDIKFVLNESLLTQDVTVRFRQGGEKIKPAGRNGSHDLKSLFQESSVPTWQRDRIPLLFVEGELVAVVGYWIADNFSVKGEGVLPDLI
ncbi:MAG: tRNA lysidine(34) synthetase TilS [endosymbiont of Galathealinum brachiosum]|uniref:tRNA(Ile)-lysidine synthase n=1 Tax=endosymbiont of Galathealinum brachiosum TaxID=2200906 RepID=A0A370DJA5_9GAMM|nr:MAG: tRNA lysidine(34) synthetase TilS [endosymbiont of Galathealinum brachiosum]